MRGMLLNLLLMAMQLLSWDGGAVYLCVASDGSSGVDFGAERCHCPKDECIHACCQHGHCQHQHSRDTHSIPTHETGMIHSFELLGGDCGCMHIPLSMASDFPSRHSEHDRTLQEQDQVAFAVNFCCTVCRTGILDQRLRLDCAPHDPHGTSLAALANIVLRC